MLNDYSTFYVKLLGKMKGSVRKLCQQTSSLNQRAKTPKKYKSVLGLRPLYMHKHNQTLAAIQLQLFRNERLQHISTDAVNYNRSATPDITSKRRCYNTATDYQ